MNAYEFKERLDRIGWKQADFARASGITPASVSGWAKGHVPIPEWADSYLGMVETLREIIAAFRDEPRTKIVELAEKRLADAARARKCEGLIMVAALPGADGSLRGRSPCPVGQGDPRRPAVGPQGTQRNRK